MRLLPVALLAGPVLLMLIGPWVAACLFDRRAPARTVATFHLLTLAGLATLPLVLLACAAVLRPGDLALTDPDVFRAVRWGICALAGAYLLRMAGLAFRATRATRRVATATINSARRVNLDGTVAYLTDARRPVAYTVGTAVVVSRGLLALLDRPERAAMLAHEQAHLRLRHHRVLLFARIVASTFGAVAPTARRAHAALARELEVIADEHAVRVTGDRPALARALAKTVLAGQPATVAGPALTGDERDLVYRLDRLTDTRPRDDRRLLATAAVGLLAVALLAVLTAVFHVPGVVIGLTLISSATRWGPARRSPARA